MAIFFYVTYLLNLIPIFSSNFTYHKLHHACDKGSAGVNTHKKHRCTNKPLVSVVIPTFNSAETIDRCLRSIKDQTYPHIETIIVDRYSWDGTLEKIEKFNTIIFIKGRERSVARNYGAAHAQGLFVFFVDSDMEVNPDVVKKCVDACLQENADAVVIPEVSIFARGFIGACRKIENELFREGFFEIPRFFKKEIFLKLGGYDDDLVLGEDNELYTRIQKAGYKTKKISAKVKHYERERSLKEIVLKAYFYAKSFRFLVKKNSSLAVEYFRIPLTYMAGVQFFSKDPVHFMGLVFMKLVEYLAYLVGIFVSFLLY